MNQCHFLGNLVQDPKLKTTPGDRKVVNFTIAVNRQFKKDGETVREAAFLDCDAWEQTAELVAKYFQKGSPIIVHASVIPDNWEDKETGKKRTKLRFRVNSIDFVPGQRKDNQGEGKGKAKPQPEEELPDGEEDDDDIPF